MQGIEDVTTEVHSLLTGMTGGRETRGGDGCWRHGTDRWAGVAQVFQHHNISMPS